MASQQFSSNLKAFKINLDSDSVDYIGGMLEDLTLTDHNEVREATETFLIDANINDKTRNDFYKALFSNSPFKGGKEEAPNKANDEPVPLNKVLQKKVEKKVKRTEFTIYMHVVWLIKIWKDCRKKQ